MFRVCVPQWSVVRGSVVRGSVVQGLVRQVSSTSQAAQQPPTFSDSEGTISENDEEQLLLAQWVDLAPVWCGIIGVGGVCGCVRV